MMTLIMGLCAVIPKPETNTLEMIFSSDNGQVSKAHIHYGAVSQLILGLTMHAAKVRPEGDGEVQTLRFVDARPATIAGDPTLILITEGDLELPIRIPRHGLPALRSVVAALERQDAAAV